MRENIVRDLNLDLNESIACQILQHFASCHKLRQPSTNTYAELHETILSQACEDEVTFTDEKILHWLSLINKYWFELNRVYTTQTFVDRAKVLKSYVHVVEEVLGQAAVKPMMSILDVDHPSATEDRLITSISISMYNLMHTLGISLTIPLLDPELVEDCDNEEFFFNIFSSALQFSDAYIEECKNPEKYVFNFEVGSPSSPALLS